MTSRPLRDERYMRLRTAPLLADPAFSCSDRARSEHSSRAPTVPTSGPNAAPCAIITRLEGTGRTTSATSRPTPTAAAGA